MNKNSGITADIAVFAGRLADRAEDIGLRLARLLAAAGAEETASLWRDSLGLAGAAGILGARPLAAVAAEVAVLLCPSTQGTPSAVADRGRLVQLRNALEQHAAGMTELAQVPVGLEAVAWVAVTDAARAASVQEMLERHGYAIQQVADPSTLLIAGDTAPQSAGGLLLCDFLPDCMPGLRAAGWFVVILGEDDSTDARLDAIRGGADRYLAGADFASRLQPILQRRSSGRGAVVLVVDDDPLSLDARSTVLRLAGFQVQALRDPLQTLQAMCASEPEVILVDAAISAMTVSEYLALLGSSNETCCESVLLMGGAVSVVCPVLAPDAPASAVVMEIARLAIGPRQRADQTRTQTLERLRNRVEFEVIDAHALVSITDRRGLIIHANDQFCAVSGYSLDELLGQNHRVLKSGQHPPEFYADIWRTISAGKMWRGLICNRRKDGPLYWVSSTIAPYLDGHGIPDRYISLRTEVTEIKLLHESARLRNQALEVASNGISIADARRDDLPLIFVNPAFEKITGYSRDEVVGRNCRFLQGDDDAQPAVAEIRQAIARREQVSVVLRNYRKDGALFWNDLHLSPVFDLEGELTHYIGVQRNITLIETQENLLATLEATGDGVLAVDTQGRVIYRSQRMEEMALFSEDTLLTGSIAELGYDLLHERMTEPERFLECMQSIQQNPRGTTLDVFEWRDGRVIERSSMPLMRGQQIAGRVWHFKDVTSSFSLQRHIESYKERLRLGQAFGNIGTWDWDITADTLFWTEHIPHILGYPDGDLEPTFANYMAVVHPDDHSALEASINATIEQGLPYDLEHRVVWPDGSVHWLLVRGAVLRDDEGRAIRLIGVLSDITDRKRAEIELLATREEAERANLAKSEFLSRMSHELRTPMNAVLGFAQIMEHDDTLPEDHIDSVSEIIRAGNHLLELINEVLDLATVESGSINLSMEPVDLESVVAECVSLLRPLADSRGIVIERRLCPTTAVRADRLRLKQALVNLMSNGIKYNREGGKLIVDEMAAKGGGWVRIRVIDTGRGLRPEQIEQAFEPFERLDVANSEVQGTGIGLPITRRLMEMMGGSVGVDSVPGSGSTFWLELMRANLPADLAAESNMNTVLLGISEHPVSADQRTIVYIEDNPSNIRLMAQVMARRPSVTLLTAHTADVGIELCLSRNPNLILLDINLSGLDGYQVLQILRTEERLRSVPIIALSASALPRDIDRGHQAGFSDYITKPLQVEYFLTVLDRHLGAAAADDQV